MEIGNLHQHRVPTPQVQAFVICREIWHCQRTGEFMLAGPASHIPITQFPNHVRVSVYAHVTGGHGRYPLDFVLRDPSGEAVWHWRPADEFDHTDPLTPCQLVYYDLLLAVPRAARYDFALMASGEEIAHQPLLIGPPEVFRGGL